jgi:hypothetical protein
VDRMGGNDTLFAAGTFKVVANFSSLVLLSCCPTGYSRQLWLS